MSRHFFKGLLVALIAGFIGLCGLFGHFYFISLLALAFSTIELIYSFYRVIRAQYQNHFEKTALFVERETSFFWLGALMGSALSPLLIVGTLTLFLKKMYG
ncbi:MAG TPA: hypothetical protein VNK47_04660 [Candidatus Dormibacteraeota bacterium]|nr:hypothetical protein [Candidatus Dormibacteraeota bacterium]